MKLNEVTTEGFEGGDSNRALVASDKIDEKNDEGIEKAKSFE